MRICQATGILHPDHLRRFYSPRQLTDWIHFYELEPWGQPAEDYRAALNAWASIMPHEDRRRRRSTPQSFMPQWGGPEPMDPKLYKAKARAVLATASARLN